MIRPARVLPLLPLLLAGCSRTVHTPAPPKVETRADLPTESSTVVVPVSASLAMVSLSRPVGGGGPECRESFIVVEVWLRSWSGCPRSMSASRTRSWTRGISRTGRDKIREQAWWRSGKSLLASDLAAQPQAPFPWSYVQIRAPKYALPAASTAALASITAK